MIVPFLTAAAVIILDQISKYIVKTNMRLGESFSFIKNILDIHYIENKGASFGILKDQRWIFMILSSVALVFMATAVIYLGRKNVRKDNRLMTFALALMLGGGIGNMIDRFSNVSAAEPGVKAVVDFIEFAFVNFATFNVADSFITIGSALFGILMLTGKYRLKEPEEDKNRGETVS